MINRRLVDCPCFCHRKFACGSCLPSMDMSSPLDMSVSEDVNGFDDLVQLSLNQLQSTSDVMGDASSNDLGDSLTEFLHMQDDKNSASDSILFSPSENNDTANLAKEDICEEPCKTKPTILTSDKFLSKCASPSEKNGTTNLVKEDICEEPCKTKVTIFTSDKCLSKCATFTCSGEAKPFSRSPNGEDGVGEDEDEEDEITAAVLKGNGNEYAKPAPPCPVPLPSPLKLVSAMKGSRDIQGTPLKKLTVTWAPDVYDPPPSDWSHVTTKKKPRNRNDSKKNNDSKKYGKSKQKGGGKPIRGKDKKQVRKSGGSSSKYSKSLDEDEDDSPYADLVDFDIGSPDSYCGSSFLKKSATKIHFSVAEAT
ncbi:hypothetical protein F0562_016753 [Nyssa sinensis]|uniref:Uncharacterized protein n=1 Tax=Nyssa sinensis TaxID=561372 RepID=A0A5J4ZDC5_9ASTE|nr:hypothetical protein F0562_016753 [Nyssa sinensis]